MALEHQDTPGLKGLWLMSGVTAAATGETEGRWRWMSQTDWKIILTEEKWHRGR